MRIEVKGAVVGYAGAVRPALDGVTLDVPHGDFTAVLGPNGSGKSTLLRSISGLLRPSSGRVLLDGKAVEAWSRRDLARAVGVVTQREDFPFPLTVEELVGMGRYPHLSPLARPGRRDADAVARALAQCDAEALRGRDVGTLSGGELQRVRIARALAQEPRALLLDEPTASLDIGHEMAILELVRRFADEAITVVLVTHDLDLAARFADTVVLLNDGRLVAQGTPEAVLDAGILQEVYGWPVSVATDPLTGRLHVVPLRPEQEDPREVG